MTRTNRRRLCHDQVAADSWQPDFGYTYENEQAFRRETRSSSDNVDMTDAKWLPIEPSWRDHVESHYLDNLPDDIPYNSYHEIAPLTLVIMDCLLQRCSLRHQESDPTAPMPFDDAEAFDKYTYEDEYFLELLDWVASGTRPSHGIGIMAKNTDTDDVEQQASEEPPAEASVQTQKRPHRRQRTKEAVRADEAVVEELEEPVVEELAEPVTILDNALFPASLQAVTQNVHRALLHMHVRSDEYLQHSFPFAIGKNITRLDQSKTSKTKKSASVDAANISSPYGCEQGVYYYSGLFMTHFHRVYASVKSKQLQGGPHHLHAVKEQNDKVLKAARRNAQEVLKFAHTHTSKMDLYTKRVHVQLGSQLTLFGQERLFSQQHIEAMHSKVDGMASKKASMVARMIFDLECDAVTESQRLFAMFDRGSQQLPGNVAHWIRISKYNELMAASGTNVVDTDGYPVHVVASDVVDELMFDADEVGRATPFGNASVRKLVVKGGLNLSRRQNGESDGSISRVEVRKDQLACCRKYDPAVKSEDEAHKNRALDRFRGMSFMTALFITDEEVEVFLKEHKNDKKHRWFKKLLKSGDKERVARTRWAMASRLQFAGFRRPKLGLRIELPRPFRATPLWNGSCFTVSSCDFGMTFPGPSNDIFMFTSPDVHVLEQKPIQYTASANPTKQRILLNKRFLDTVSLATASESKRRLKEMVASGDGFVGIGMTRCAGEEGEELYQQRVKDKTAVISGKVSLKYDEVIRVVATMPSLALDAPHHANSVELLKKNSRLPLDKNSVQLLYDAASDLCSWASVTKRATRLLDATSMFCKAYEVSMHSIHLSSVEERVQVRLTPLSAELLDKTSPSLKRVLQHNQCKRVLDLVEDAVLEEMLSEVLTSLRIDSMEE